MLKAIIVVLVLAMVASLFSGFVFLFKDVGKQDSRRTLHALGIRVSIAILLLLVIGYGLYTGQLGVNAPWHRGGTPG